MDGVLLWIGGFCAGAVLMWLFCLGVHRLEQKVLEARRSPEPRGDESR